MRRVAILILAALCLPPPAGAQEADLALAVKAAYMVKFQPFITWPASSFAGPAAPFTLCVAGRDPFGALIDRAAADQRFDGRAVAVRRIADATDSAGCQILYLAAADPLTLRQSLDAVRNRPMLTVTDAAEQPDAQGMINFLVIDSRIRFTIDDEAAEASGLDISSKLLSLAVSVRRKGGKE